MILLFHLIMSLIIGLLIYGFLFLTVKKIMIRKCKFWSFTDNWGED